MLNLEQRKREYILFLELMQRLTANKSKVKRCEQRISQFRQNQLYQVNQKQMYKDLTGEKQGDRIIPNSDDSTKF